jgi:polyisoprenoid-binding protein YceI
VTGESETHRFGPANGQLIVRTGRRGAIAKIGHDLRIVVTQWEATLSPGDPAELELEADAGSLHVIEGTGGLQSLSAEDKANIDETVATEVLKNAPITFRSTNVVESNDGRRRVRGDLVIGELQHPLEFVIDTTPEGDLSATATVTQTHWGIEPYSTLFGTLKVADDVVVEFVGKPL